MEGVLTPAERRTATRVLAGGVGVYVLGLAWVIASGSAGLLALAIGGPLWFILAYRWPMIGIAILSAGQFLLRFVVGGVTALSRGDPGSSTVVTGAILLLPLVVAAVVRGDLTRVRRAWHTNRMVLWPIAAMSVAIVASYLLVPSTYGRLKVLAYLGLNLPLFGLALLLIRSEREARQLLVATIAVSFGTLASSLAGSSAIFEQTALHGTRRVVGSFAEQNVDVGKWFARRVAIGGLAAVAALLMTRSRRPILLWASAAVLFAGAGLAASRGPVVGAGLALVVMILTPGPRVRRTGARTGIVLVAITAGLIALATLPPDFAARYATTFNPQDESLQNRLRDLDQSAELVARSPLVGIGLGRYPIALFGVDRIIYPHSLLLEFASELGIPMAVLLLVLAAGSLRYAWSAARRAPPWVAALALWAIGMQVLSFLDGQLSGDLRTNEHVWFAAGVAVAAAHLARRARLDDAGPLETAARAGPVPAPAAVPPGTAAE